MWRGNQAVGKLLEKAGSGDDGGNVKVKLKGVRGFREWPCVGGRCA